MKTNIGMWIDHRRAVIVVESSAGEEIKVILSDADRQPGRSHGERSNVSFEALHTQADDVSERKFTAQLHRYYEEVVACVRHADGLLVFGPGEAKGQFVKELEKALPKGHVVSVETADKMTDRQIAAHVRDHFAHEGPVISLH
jgi:peptide subunit release factor 1 (eRF1)